ncbi:MAG: hypothetical protein HFI72_06390 [Peptococcaceae bacterium]|nr:hypothetical protein [Peptococcaceae bacterium]
MIFITLTKPERKLRMVARVALVALLLGVIVPMLYLLLTHAGSMAQFVSKEDGIPGEPIRVTAPPQEGFVGNLWLDDLLETMSAPSSQEEMGKQK